MKRIIKITTLICILLCNVSDLFAQTAQQRADSIVKVFLKEKNVEQKELLLKEWESFIPPSKVNGYDYPRLVLAHAFAMANNFDKAYEYIMKMDTMFYRVDGTSSMARHFIKHGDTVRGIKLYKHALKSGEPFRDSDAKTSGNNAMFARESYLFTLPVYFNLMYEMGNFKEAAQNGRLVDKYLTKKDSTFYFKYAKTLLAVNKSAESLIPIENYMKAGGNNKMLLAKLNSAYSAAGKPQKEFKKYFAGLRSMQAQAMKQNSTYQTAPAFTLKDLNGKMVSLKDLKGKVVVLDFWATWCGPCIKSFPAMQKAVTHYKSDSDVVFLFIDTFESIADYELKVKELITASKYDFNVLFDPKDKSVGKCLVANSYEVKNIPTKIIIDPKGKIRFRVAGFKDDEKLAVEELVSMVESAKKA